MFEATKKCDVSFDGKFFMGVLTTGIYCLPSCKAKMPLEKNVRFFSNKISAINFGLRGCKRCRSEFYPNTQPPWLDYLLNLFNNNQDIRLTEKTICDVANVNITTIRRYFKHYYGTTPFAYHRKIRLEYAKTLIKKGLELLEIPYHCGFSSLSGFRTAFEKQFGILPGEFVNGNTLQKT